MSEIHYFQRYSQKENVTTNNALLLLSRLYHYSPNKFSAFLRELLKETEIQPGIAFKQQGKQIDSVPDGSISQESFKIVIETKLKDDFPVNQIINHCKSFKNEEKQILFSLSPYNIKEVEIQNEIEKFNKEQNKNIKYFHCKSEDIIKNIRSILKDNDFEFEQILDDFADYCFEDNLIVNRENWLRAVTCGLSYKENFKYNLYYEPSDRGYSKHGYIGVYYNKAINGIGKIINVVTADYINNELIIRKKDHEVTDDQKNRIINSMKEAKANEKRGWDIFTGHRFFIVDNFETTNFEKKTKYPLQGTKFFNLADKFSIEQLNDTNKIADLLKKETWETW